MHKIDKIDYDIVRLLMHDGRMPCVDIARKIGISGRSVRYRLDRLIDEKIIQVRAISNPMALGYTVIADVFIEVEPGLIPEVAQNLVNYDCVSYVACSTGERDISVQVIAKTNAEVYSFVTEVIGKIPGVRKTTTSIVPITLKDIYDWCLPLSDCVSNS
jgi:Lrp/AsnC family transcriptional regulator for asnA, asnC and gidA